MDDTLKQLRQELENHSDDNRATFASNWFKNRPGYPPDDLFLGVKVPELRKIAKQFYKTISLSDTTVLVHSKWHEERLIALLILVQKYQKIPRLKQDIFDLYIENLQFVNNWDLVDSSAHLIVGEHLKDNAYKMKVLLKMANAKGVWERRVAMIATLQYIRAGSAEEAILIAKKLLHDKDDYIHKAVGWMLREVGARVDQKVLLDFLDKHAHNMPRTALRYAIEHLDIKIRKHYMRLKNA